MKCSQKPCHVQMAELCRCHITPPPPYPVLTQYRSFNVLSSSIRVLFWFSRTATRFSRHLTYSFFFRRHSRAASLKEGKLAVRRLKDGLKQIVVYLLVFQTAESYESKATVGLHINKYIESYNNTCYLQCHKTVLIYSVSNNLICNLSVKYHNQHTG